MENCKLANAKEIKKRRSGCFAELAGYKLRSMEDMIREATTKAVKNLSNSSSENNDTKSIDLSTNKKD
ncbi:MAG: hypothetical protein A2033_14760 [Bacteroidetes bacterium GWA2_31_9]|nr:MAG: hypothetical protein A2033_14760 [Bacteroidetes bacterium GWA2_31_9]